MKILHINTYDYGGAANACLRLHDGLLKSGIDSKVLVRHKSYNIFPEIYAYEPEIIPFSKRLKRKIQRILKEFYLYKEKVSIPELEIESQNLQKIRLNSLEMISFPESNIDITNNKLFSEADIIHLHWVASFLDYKTFFIKCQKPIVWTFHDQNPFLGVEHYAEIFFSPDNQGLPIARQFDDYELKIEEKYKRVKREIFKNIPINIVALCNWMKTEIIKSQMFPLAKINIIPNGIDSAQFKILDKTFCRELLNLPLSKKIILFVSDDINNNRKGLNYLLKSFEEINIDNLLICSIGKNMNSQLKHSKINFIELGKVYDQRLMNVAYCIADVFITPSFMETFGLTIVESLLCGIPVISFPNGGSYEIIKDEFNGYITKDLSVDALSEAINIFFSVGIKWEPTEIRKDAIERYDISLQVKKIKQLYTDVFNS